MASNSDIHVRIKELVDMFSNGNVSAFAKRVGTNETNIRNYINGKTPKFDFLARLCKELGICCEWLMLGEGPITAKASQENINIINNKEKVLFATNGDVTHNPVKGDSNYLHIIEQQSKLIADIQLQLKEQTKKNQELTDKLIALISNSIKQL